MPRCRYTDTGIGGGGGGVPNKPVLQGRDQAVDARAGAGAGLLHVPAHPAPCTRPLRASNPSACLHLPLSLPLARSSCAPECRVEGSGWPCLEVESRLHPVAEARDALVDAARSQPGQGRAAGVGVREGQLGQAARAERAERGGVQAAGQGLGSGRHTGGGGGSMRMILGPQRPCTCCGTRGGQQGHNLRRRGRGRAGPPT